MGPLTQNIPLFDPKEAPFMGMYSALQPSAMQTGQWALAQNVRPDDGCLMARWPTVDLSATGLVGSTPLGIWSGKLNGTVYVVVALWDGSHGRLFIATDGIAYTEITSVSGVYLASSAKVFFAVVKEPWTGYDLLIVQNGSDNPLVYDRNGSTIKFHTQHSAPTLASGYAPAPVMPSCSFPMSSLTTGGSELITSMGNVTFTWTNPTTKVAALKLSISTSATSSDTATIDLSPLGTTVNMLGQQLCMVTDAYGSLDWASFKVEIYDSTAAVWYTLNDPGSTTAPIIQTFTDSSISKISNSTLTNTNAYQVVAFDLSAIATTNRAHVQKMRFTYKGSTLTAALSVFIVGIFSSGTLPFGTQFGISNFNPTSRSESAGVTMQASTAYGAGTFGPQVPGACFPLECNVPYLSGLYYNYLVQTPPVGSSDYSAGVTKANIYAELNGATTAIYAAQVAVNTSSQQYTLLTSTGSGTDVNPTTIALDPSRIQPDAYAICMPKGTAMATGNARTFVATSKGYSFSESNQPFRFRLLLDPSVERSAGLVLLQGETTQAFVSVPASDLGSTTILIYTDRATYIVSGFDGYSLSKPSKVLNSGTFSPFSVAAYKQYTYWLDDNRQVRKYTAGAWNYPGQDPSQAISRRVVDDQTKAVPGSYLGNVVGLASYDRLYFAYAPSGGTTNTNMLVWDEVMQMWLLDTLPVGAQAMCNFDNAGVRQVLFLGSDAHVYQHEATGTAGTVAVRLTSLETA